MKNHGGLRFICFTAKRESSMIRAHVKKGVGCLINQVTLVGRLVKDPELRYTPDGKAVSNITLAVNRNFRNQEGGYDADFVHCTLWKKVAENTVQYCRKGSIIGITGRIQTRNYENQEGKKMYVTEVVAEGVRFMGPKQSSLKQEETVPIEMLQT